MNRPLMKELMIEAYQDTSILNSVAANLDNLDFKKVKTKYVKTGWDALSLHGYGKHPLDILKPGIIKKAEKLNGSTGIMMDDWIAGFITALFILIFSSLSPIKYNWLIM